jgi:hypothetical protein
MKLLPTVTSVMPLRMIIETAATKPVISYLYNAIAAKKRLMGVAV